MSARRQRAKRIGPVARVVESTVPGSTTTADGPVGTQVDRAIALYVEAGKRIIGAAVVAIVDAATELCLSDVCETRMPFGQACGANWSKRRANHVRGFPEVGTAWASIETVPVQHLSSHRRHRPPHRRINPKAKVGSSRHRRSRA